MGKYFLQGLPNVKTKRGKRVIINTQSHRKRGGDFFAPDVD